MRAVYLLSLVFAVDLVAQTNKPVLRQLSPIPNLTVLGNTEGFTAIPGPLTVANLMTILSGAPATSNTLGVVQCDGVTITCSQGVITAVGGIAPGSVVTKFNNRTGTVVSTLGDYTFAMITGNLVLGQFPVIAPLTVLGNAGGTSAVPSALTSGNLITIIGNGAIPGLVAGDNVTITGDWPNQTITASSTAGTAFSSLTGSTNTTAAMVVGTGASLAPTGSGTISATAINGTAMGGLGTGILKNTTTTGVPSIAVAGDFPTLNQSTTGNALTSTTTTNMSGGVQGSVPYQSGANVSVFLAPNTTATDQVLISHGTGSGGQSPTFSNAPVLSAANMTAFPTFNQSTSGNAATATALAATPSLCSTGQAPTGVLANGNATGCASIAGSSGITALTGDVTASGTGSVAATVKGINGTLLSGLGTGIVKNTTTTGVPSIAIASDFPTLNQNTSGTAAGLSATLGVASGGTGIATTTAYSVLAGGTTATGAFQHVSGVGSANQVLTSNGASALPTWQAVPVDAFSAITAGTNTTAAMVVGTGASLAPTSATAGTVSANQINATSMAGLATGILKNTTTTGVPSIAVAGDFPTLNQNTSGTAANVTGTVAIGNGGSGQTTATAAFGALAPTASRAGDVLYWTGTAWASLAGNNSGTNFFQENASGTPSWAAGSSAIAWGAISNPSGNLALTMGSNTSTFNYTTALSNAFQWGNTTAATSTVSQSSPILSLCGTAWHAAASAQDCLTLQDQPGNTTDAPITFAFGHSGSSTGAVSVSFPGPIQAGASSGVGGSLSLPEGTTATASTGNDICYGDSTLHGVKCSFNNGSFLNLPLETGTMTSGDLVSVNATTNLLADSGVVSANVVSAAGTLTNNAVMLGGGTKAASTISADTTTTHALFATAGAPAFRALAAGDVPASLTSTTSVNGTSIPSSATLMTTATALVAAQEPAHTGDMTNSAGSLATTVGSIGGKTVTLSGNLTTTGAFNPTFAIPSSSTWTFPAGPSTLMSTATSLVAGQMPALTGDVTNSAGSLATSVGKLLGNTVPVNATGWLHNDGAGVLAWSSPAGAGTVTSVATTAPITGGTFTTTGTIACATCVTSAAALTSNAVTIGGGGQASSTIAADTTTTHALFATAGAPAFRALAAGDIPAALTSSTSINKMAITAPTTSSTLAVADGKTLTASNTLTLAGTDSTTMTFPSVSATISRTVASGTAALGTGAIASGVCATVVTATATGTLTTDVVTASFNGDPTAVTGYAPTVNGMLSIITYPTADTFNVKVCNNTSASVTPGAITLNWRVIR